MHLGYNSGNIYFLLCGHMFAVIWHLDGQMVGQGFIKIAHSFWQRAILTRKVGCSKVLTRAVALSSCKYCTVTLPASGCRNKQEMTARFSHREHPQPVRSAHPTSRGHWAALGQGQQVRGLVPNTSIPWKRLHFQGRSKW